jgi:hypothetical protein
LRKENQFLRGWSWGVAHKSRLLRRRAEGVRDALLPPLEIALILLLAPCEGVLARPMPWPLELHLVQDCEGA